MEESIFLKSIKFAHLTLIGEPNVADFLSKLFFLFLSKKDKTENRIKIEQLASWHSCLLAASK